MNYASEPEFDRYAGGYTELHRASIRTSGEERAYFSRYEAQYMAHMLGKAEAGAALSVLDVGCGIGNSIPHLREAFPRAQLAGVDPSGESIDLAHQTYARTATFRVNAADTIPYPDRSFDLIHMACVFHRVRLPQRGQWMHELRRVLKPGGELFVFEHNVLTRLTLKAVRDCAFDEDAILLPRRELIGLAKAAGFPRINARYIVIFPAPMASFRLLEPMLGLVPLGAQYVVPATA